MGVFVGPGGSWEEPVGEAMILYMTSVPMGGEKGFDRRLPGVIPSGKVDRVDRVGICRRFGFSMGAVGGGSETFLSWEHVGTALPFEVSATPAAAGFCESGDKALGVLVSLESAPWYRYRIPWGWGEGDTRVRHMASVTAGQLPAVGAKTGEAFRVILSADQLAQCEGDYARFQELFETAVVAALDTAAFDPDATPHPA